VELVALMPLLGVVAAVVFHLLAAGTAGEAAGHAAHSAAAAMLQDRDPQAAALAALPGWPSDHVRVERSAGRVEVSVRPRGGLEALARRLTARAVAHAGPVGPVSPGVFLGGDGVSSDPPRSRNR